MTIGRSQIPYTCFLRLFCSWSPSDRVLRLGRLVWRRGEGPGADRGYCAKFSFGLAPKLLSWERGWWSFLVVLCGVRLHYQRSYGGWVT